MRPTGKRSNGEERPWEIMARLGISPSRKKGQNFLMDRNISRIQIAAAEVEPGDRVLEIGPGLGFLTKELLDSGARLTAVEQDRSLYHYLRDNLAGRYSDLDLIHGNFLKLEIGGMDKVVSNIPYNISSPVTFRLHELEIGLAVLMYQYEFAVRLVAGPGTRDYSRLSVMVQHDYLPTMIKRVSRNVFYPKPGVDSALVKLVRRERAEPALDRDRFARLVRASFSARRKKLRNSLLCSEDPDIRALVKDSGLAVHMERRAGDISVEDYVMISNRGIERA